MPKYKTALVTGGAGFIGSHIVDALIRRRIKVYVIDDLSTGSRKNLNPNATFYKMSIVDEAAKKLVMRLKPDVIFHLAAQIDVRCSVEDPPADARINVMGTLNIAHAAAKAGVKKFIFTSSGGAMYPDTLKPPYSEKTPDEPLSPYAISKRSAEMYLDFEHRIHGLNYVILRLANAYGPRQALRGGYAGVISVFTRQMLAGEKVLINGTGKQTRDYVFVSDIVHAHMLAMEKNVTGTFNIGTGIQTTVNTLFAKLKKLTGIVQKELYGPAAKGEVMRCALDARKALKELGWKPEVPLEEGLKKTVLWFKNI